MHPPRDMPQHNEVTVTATGAGGRQRAPRYLTPVQWGTRGECRRGVREGAWEPRTVAELRGRVPHGCSHLSVTAKIVHFIARARKAVNTTDGRPDVTRTTGRGRCGHGDGDRSAALQQALVRLWAPARHASGRDWVGTRPGAGGSSTSAGQVSTTHMLRPRCSGNLRYGEARTCAKCLPRAGDGWRSLMSEDAARAANAHRRGLDKVGSAPRLGGYTAGKAKALRTRGWRGWPPRDEWQFLRAGGCALSMVSPPFGERGGVTGT